MRLYKMMVICPCFIMLTSFSFLWSEVWRTGMVHSEQWSVHGLAAQWWNEQVHTLYSKRLLRSVQRPASVHPACSAFEGISVLGDFIGFISINQTEVCWRFLINGYNLLKPFLDWDFSRLFEMTSKIEFSNELCNNMFPIRLYDQDPRLKKMTVLLMSSPNNFSVFPSSGSFVHVPEFLISTVSQEQWLNVCRILYWTMTVNSRCID